jgi:hypothetical protein
MLSSSHYILKVLLSDLFSLERAEKFELISLSPQAQSQVLDVSLDFNAISLKEIFGINKLNPRSSVYLAPTRSNGHIILKSTDLSFTDKLEEQCRIASLLPDQLLVRPIKSHSGQFVSEKFDRAWMAYKAIEGTIFDGKNLKLNEALSASWNLSFFLQGIPRSEALDAWQHRPEIWPSLWNILTDINQCAEALSDSGITFGQSTLGMLCKNADELKRIVERVALLAQDLELVTVHNDLQHANILVSESKRPVFLDLEDICLESVQVSVMHGFFKIIRHCVYSKTISPLEAKKLLPSALASLVKHPVWVGGSASALDYALLRIVSDISEIFSSWVNDADATDLYDLEKRIHNLFELVYLFGV